LRVDLAQFAPGAPPGGTPEPTFVPGGVNDADLPLGRTQRGALLHIYEELAQHRGQMEVTRDLIQAGDSN